MVLQLKAVAQHDLPLYASLFFGVVSTLPLLLGLKVNRLGEQGQCLEIWQNPDFFSRRSLLILTEAQGTAIDSFSFFLSPVSTWGHSSKGS